MPNNNAPAVKPEVVFIEELLDEIAAGKLRVPRFQRPYIWKPSDMLNLFDSIGRSYPIGSLLIWDSVEKLNSLDKVGPLSIPPPTTTPFTYILDGHQRLATLFGGLRLSRDHPRDSKVENWRWWIWFDLREKKFTHFPKGETPAWFLPLRALLRTVDFLEVARRIQNECQEDASQLIEEAEQLAQKIKNYKVALIRIKGGSLSQAVEIFSRLNTLGRNMTPDQMVSALTYSEEAGAPLLDQRINEILEALTVYDFGNINRLTIFRSILAAADMYVHKSEWESLAKRLNKDMKQAIDAAESGLLAAAYFLNTELGVPGDMLLPYAHQMLLLSVFFHQCSQPTETQKTILKKWFWVTSLAGWFAGANSTQINNAIDEMRNLAQNEHHKLQVMPLDELARPFPNKFDMRSARIRALLIFLLRLNPLDTNTAKSLNAGHILREHKYLFHIFPRARAGMISSPANRILLARVPGKSVKDQIRSIDPKNLSEILKSHGIPDEAYQALLRDDDSGFIELRAQHLAQIEQNFMQELGISSQPGTDFGEADIDTDDE